MRKALGEFMGDCKLEISERINLEFGLSLVQVR